VNAVVGSGSLISFPTLLAFGYSPIVANVSNNVGLVPGSAGGTFGYRRELAGQRSRVGRLAVGSLLGGILGAVLLLVLPAHTFKIIVPVFVAVAVGAVLFQPRIAAAIGRPRGERHGDGGLPALLGVFVSGLYGGYFGAAQGIFLLGVLGLALDEELHRINALKNVLAGTVNAVAAVVFAVAADVNWAVAGLLASGSILGGLTGGRYGRRLPRQALRALVAVVGVAAIVQLLN